MSKGSNAWQARSSKGGIKRGPLDANKKKQNAGGFNATSLLKCIRQREYGKMPGVEPFFGCQIPMHSTIIIPHPCSECPL